MTIFGLILTGILIAGMLYIPSRKKYITLIIALISINTTYAQTDPNVIENKLFLETVEYMDVIGKELTSISEWQKKKGKADANEFITTLKAKIHLGKNKFSGMNKRIYESTYNLWSAMLSAQVRELDEVISESDDLVLEISKLQQALKSQAWDTLSAFEKIDYALQVERLSREVSDQLTLFMDYYVDFPYKSYVETKASIADSILLGGGTAQLSYLLYEERDVINAMSEIQTTYSKRVEHIADTSMNHSIKGTKAELLYTIIMNQNLNRKK